MKKLFTINLYDYLSLDKAKVCRDYQNHNEEVISKYNELNMGDKWEYVKVDIDEELDSFVNDSTKCISPHMPAKYRYQMISDLVRYKYMMQYPDSIYIDTDFCIFGTWGMALLNQYSYMAEDYKKDFMAGELNKNRLFPCNWLMIGGGCENNIFKDMYDMLYERMKLSTYEVYEYDSATSKWADKMEDYIWTQLWGYAIPRELQSKKYGILPYESFQGCEWNKDWHDDSIMHKNELSCCHFFGFGEGGRPDWKEFIQYHGITETLDIKLNED